MTPIPPFLTCWSLPVLSPASEGLTPGFLSSVLRKPIWEMSVLLSQGTLPLPWGTVFPVHVTFVPGDHPASW